MHLDLWCKPDLSTPLHAGVLVVRALSLGDGGDDVTFLLRRANDAPILELVVPNEGLMGSIAPGQQCQGPKAASIHA